MNLVAVALAVCWHKRPTVTLILERKQTKTRQTYKGINMTEEYLMIDRRGFTGNDVVFWNKDHRGYTTDIDKAHRFSEEEAIKTDCSRSTDCAIPLKEVVAVCRRVVDHQYLDRKYFCPTYSFFAPNTSNTAHELEVKNLKWKLAKFESLFDDMEYCSDEYNMDFDQIVNIMKEESKKIMKEEKFVT